MKKLTTYQKCETGFSIVFSILATIGSYKNNMSMAISSAMMFTLAVNAILHSCASEDIDEIKERVKVLEEK